MIKKHNAWSLQRLFPPYEGIAEKELQPGERVTLFGDEREVTGLVLAVIDKGDVYVLWSIKTIEKFQQRLKALFLRP